MQENNFEKKVREKMDALSLQPSEPVWQKVEASLKKKRRDRGLLYWILPLLLITGGLALWQLTSRQPLNTDINRAETNGQQRETFSKPHVPASPQNEEKSVTSTKTKLPEKSLPARTHATQSIISGKKMDQNIVIPLYRSVAGKKQRNEIVIDIEPSTTKSVKSVPADPTGISKAPLQEALKDTLVQDQKPNIDTAAFIKEDTTAAAVPVVSKPAPRVSEWKLALTGRAGASNQVGSLFAGFAKESSRQWRGRMYNSGSASPDFANDSLNRGGQPFSTASGFQFSIGTLVKKTIGKSSYVFSGFRYSYYSSRQATGAALPAPYLQANLSANAQRAFGNGNEKWQTNTYHYIEVPLGIEYQVLKKHPLHVQHGITINRLIYSNALQYDSRANIYYVDKSGLNKTGVGIFTGMVYTIYKSGKTTLQAGPELQYGLRNIFKSPYPGSHLLSGAFTASIQF